MKESILKAIEDKYKLSGGNNGIYITTLKLTFNIAQKELSKILNELFTEKLIKVSYGMHGQMAMLKNPKITFFKPKKRK